MARPKSFDPDQAMGKAVDYFWHHGYEATTVRDLAQHMQINSSSFYDTFGTKHAVYIASLQRYMDQEYAQLISNLPQAPSPLALIRIILDYTLDGLLSSKTNRGSFTVNAMIERAPHDPEIRRLIAENSRRYEIILREYIAQGQASGEISCRHSADVLTDVLLAAFNSLHLQARLDPGPEKLSNICIAILSLFEDN